MKPTKDDNPPVQQAGEAAWRGKNLLMFTQGLVPLLIAVAVLYLFWSLVKSMMGLTKAPELEWNRAAYVFAGVEAIAYAAAGFLFGREVHRQRAEQAEQRAQGEQQRAAKAERKATEETTKGQALRQVIDAKKSSRHKFGRDLEGLEGFRAESRGAGETEMDELSKIARELFP